MALRPFTAREGFDASGQQLRNLGDPRWDQLSDGVNLATALRNRGVGTVQTIAQLPAPIFDQPIVTGTTYLIRETTNGEPVNRLVAWNETAPQAGAAIQQGEWIEVDPKIWLSQVKGAQAPLGLKQRGDLHVVVDQSIQFASITVWDEVSGSFLPVYDTDLIREYVAATNLFEGTVVPDGQAVPGAIEFSQLPDLTSTDPQVIDDNLIYVAHYWTFTLNNTYTVLPGDACGVGRDLAGAVLSPGDWLQVVNRGTTGAPDLQWVAVLGEILSKSVGDSLYAKLIGGFGVYTPGRTYPATSVIQHRGLYWESLADIDPAPAAIDLSQWKVLGSEAVGPYEAGRYYEAGCGVEYDGLLFRTLEEIPVAPAQPDHTKWQVYGAQQSAYWQGGIPATDANWVVGNWVHLCTVPIYWSGSVFITQLIASNDASYRLSLSCGYSSGDMAILSTTKQGAGGFSKFRLSQAANGQSFRLEGRIASNPKPGPMKLFVDGISALIAGAVPAATCQSPPVAIAGGVNMGGTEREVIDANIREFYTGLRLNNGDTNVAGNNYYQLGFGYTGQFRYPHYIVTRHNGAANTHQNAFDFYVNDGTQFPANENPGTNSLWGGSISAYGISLPLGTAAKPSLNFGNQDGGGDVDTGIWSPGDGIVAITTNGSEEIRWNDNQMILQTNGTVATPAIC